MSILYLDCSMGAAGDMLGGALLDLFDNREELLTKLNGLGIPGVTFESEPSVKCGITGSHLRVTVNGTEEDEHMHDHHHEHDHEHGHSHSHRSLHGIEHIVNDHLTVNDNVKKQTLAVYRIIADAESHVHGVPADEIHFHEVGTMDAVADITAVCYLLDLLKVTKICASPVHVGRGTVRCAHGILPVPAPATAYILRGIPTYSKEQIEGELCTPTGAALLKHFAGEFRTQPVMKTERIGYGMGKKDFPIANCVRAFLGEETDETQIVCELDFNVDDMTGEEIGFVTSLLLEHGAYEVFTTPIQMKKSRPGTLVTVICSQEKRDELGRLIFRHSSTLGIRYSSSSRMIMKRHTEEKETPYGPMRLKTAEGYGTVRSKYEYEDLARASAETGLSIREIKESLK